MRWAVLGVLVVLAGCVGPGPPQVDEPDPCGERSVAERAVIAERPGDSRFVLTPEPPVLEPGQATRFNASFTNAGPCPFFFSESGAASAKRGTGPNSHVLRFGDGALLLTERNLHPPAPGGPPVATGATFISRIQPNETYAREGAWNGSFYLWDHTGVERGEGWARRWFWAAPGSWPLSYGFTTHASYPTETKTQLDVVENDLNRGSGIHPGRCKDARNGATVSGASVEARPNRTTVGSPVRIYVNYTVTLGQPGCWLAHGAPRLLAYQGSRLAQSDVGRACDESPGVIYLEASSTAVVGHLVLDWSGTDPCASTTAAATAGVYGLRLNTGGFLHGLPSTGDLARVELG